MTTGNAIDGTSQKHNSHLRSDVGYRHCGFRLISPVIAASAIALFAAHGTFAANSYYWNGSYNASFPQKANWENASGTAPSAHVNGQTEDNLWFQENKYDAKFTGTNNRTVKFSTVVTNTRKVFIRDNGTESAPLVFDLNGNVSAACGLVAGVSTSAGTGTVVADYDWTVGDGGTTCTMPISITNTATLAITAGKNLTTGAITVNTNATLQVAESGTNTVNSLTLADGAVLGFNFTKYKNPPVLDLTGKTVTFGSDSNVVVKVSASNVKRAKSGKHVLTVGGAFANANVTLVDKPDWVRGVSVNDDGDIVLKAISTGLVIVAE